MYALRIFLSSFSVCLSRYLDEIHTYILEKGCIQRLIMMVGVFFTVSDLCGCQGTSYADGCGDRVDCASVGELSCKG